MTPPAAPRRILFVDDEAQLLDGVKKALRPWRQVWQVETALGGRAAWEALEQQPFDAIVSDARMPEVDGEQVLQRARERQPGAVRLVLSGQVDAKTGHRLASVAHQFLAKPSPVGAIIAAVEDCCRVRDALVDPALMKVVAAMGSLPLSPALYHRITSVIDSPTSSLDEVAGLVSDSVSLSAMLLRLVSSAYFGLPRKVSRVQDAVAMLGLEAVREVVLLMEVFNEPDELGVMEELKRRSLFRSRLARRVAEGSPMTALAAEAGLLADLGSYVLALRMPGVYRALWERHLRERLPLRQLEFESLGITHDAVGAALLGLWNLPATVVTAVACGHELPGADAVVDTRTVLALTLRLEEEVLEIRRPGAAEELQRLATQLGLESRLPSLRDGARMSWASLSKDSAHE